MKERKRHTPVRRARTLCQRCGSHIPPVARKYGDPFCSRICAEATYGTRSSSALPRLLLSLPRMSGGRGPDHTQVSPWPPAATPSTKGR